ncbi:hypothetical protein [Avibacterium paragallinarum]|uniref:hypothetical protein n=1 Tax=Avibacterium paragallinarum TaxID=728 RepID=UPI001029C170|nr:hypothetical protein [Avibacterium paragallinarum]RZN55099.1 hypothetical protein EIG78_11340 [Avibacterium paragallinarum]
MATRKEAATTAKTKVKRKAKASAAILKRELKLEEGQWETKRGRPYKFDPDLAIEKMEAAINDYVEGKLKYYELIQKDSEGKKMDILGVAFPTITRMALLCGVDEQTFTDNCTAKNEDGSIKNKQLFGAYKRFKDLGKTMLVEGGLVGMYDSRLVQFLGNVNYDLIPKQQVESTVEVKSMDKVYEELDAILASGQEETRLMQERAEMEERKALLDAENEEA